MSELFLLIAVTVATLVLLAGLVMIFKGWLERREEIEREAGR